MLQVIAFNTIAQQREISMALNQPVFIENKGQWDSQALFMVQLNNKRVWITNTGFLIDQYKEVSPRGRKSTKFKLNNPDTQSRKFTSQIVNFNFPERSEKVGITTNKKSETKRNYYLGNQSSKQIRDVSCFDEVEITNFIQGIDVKYYIENNNLRYDFILKPFANPDLLNFTIDGCDSLQLTQSTNLSYRTFLGTTNHGELFAYQWINGKRKEIACSFQLNGKKVKFKIDEYDHSKELIIDPLVFSTFIGGNSSDSDVGLFVNNQGESYLTGTTQSVNFPTTSGLGTYTAQEDLFVTKVNATGSALVYSTVLGGDGNESGWAIDVDDNGNAVVLGFSTSPLSATAFPTTAGAFANTNSGLMDQVILKLDPTGALLYATYFGGSSDEQPGRQVRIDATGNIFVVGSTGSNNLPVVNGLPYNGLSDIFIAKFNSTLSTLLFSTHIGSVSSESAEFINITPQNEIFIGGLCNTSNIVTTPGAIANSNAGLVDIVLFKLEQVGANQNNYSITHSTYFGGSSMDLITGMELNANGELVFCGGTASSNFIIVNPIPGFSTLNASGNYDVFLTVVNNNLTITNASTFWGGSDYDYAGALSIDNLGGYHLSGITTSTNLPTTPTAFDNTLNAGFGLDVFYVKISPQFNVLYATYFGGEGDDWTFALHGNQNEVYLSGSTFSLPPSSTDPFPITSGAFQTLPGGSYDVFLSKLDLCVPLQSTISATVPSVCGGSLSLFANGGIAGLNYTYTWQGPPLSGFTSSLQNPVIPSVGPTYSGNYFCTVTDANGCFETLSISVTVPSVSFTASIQSATPNGAPCGPGDLLGFPSPGNYTYTWTDPLGGITTNVNNNGYGAALIGTYTLVVTDANGCTSSATYTIFNPPTVNAFNSATTSICSNSPVTLSATPPSYVSYNWLPGTGLNQATVTVNPSGPTTYTVTIVDANGCTATSTTFVNTLPQKFCCSQAAINISNNTSTILLDNQDANYLINNVGNSTLNGLTLFINGTFTLNQSMQWNNCRVYFTENAKIMIDAGKTLDIQQNSELSSPDDCPMWDGIYASGTGAQLITQGNANITTGHNIIRDMINGVQISLNAKLTSSLTHYDDNKLSISLIDLPASYNGTIEKNTFKYQSGLKAPYTGDKPQTGITVSNALHVVIGSPTVSGNGNSFDGLHNGIYLTYYQPNPFTAPPAVVNMYHNVFTNIVGGINLWDVVSPNSTQNLYNDIRGCAILGINRRQQYHVTANIYGNSMPTNTLNNFTDCNKAVILNGFHTTIHRNTTFNTQAGFLNAQCDGKSISVSKNKLVGARLGISKVGDEANFDVNDNELSMADPYPTQAGLYVPLAINSTYITAQNTGTTDIFSNYIDFSHPDYATGIHLLNGSRDFIRNNQIDFLYSGNDPSATTVPNLFGIDLANNDGVHVFANHVLGLNAPNFLNLRRAAGINMHKNKSSLVECNTLSNLQVGLHVVGDNNCNNYDRVRHNTLNNQNNGILLRHLSNEGTLGNIGEFIQNPFFTYDANNLFQGAMQSFKVLRITPCSFSTTDKIVTQPNQLVQAQSTTFPTNNNCRYQVINPSNLNIVFECIPDLIEEPILGNIERAELIALENSEYLEYEEGGRWLDERMVMEWLNRDPDLRLNSPILNNYYLAHQQHALQYLYEIDQLLAALASINVMQNPTLWQQKYQTALALNQTINGSNLFETNEKILNGLYLNYLGSGMESLTIENLLWIESLAQKCPYLDGQAVFKARTLYAMLVGPKTYNDLQICNTVGIYKGSQSWYEQENASLFQRGNDQVGTLLVFPNPGLDFVTFKLTEPNLLLQSVRIYNMAGQQVLEDTQLNQSGIKRMDIKNLIQGLYTYHCVDSNGLVYTGKLIKY